MGTSSLNDIARALAGEFSTALSAAGGTVGVTPTPAAKGDGWVTAIVAGGRDRGGVTAWIDQAGATAMMTLVLGSADGGDGAIQDLLKEMWAQAASAVCLMPEFKGLTLTVGTVIAADADGRGVGFSLSLGEGAASLVIQGSVETVAAAAQAPAVSAPAAATAAGARSADPAQAPNLEVVLDIELPLVVRFGRTVMSLKSLSLLGPGSIVDMGRSPDEPVDLMISDRVIAHGEVVIVSGNYGVRVTDLVSPSDRVRTVEA